MKDVLMRLPSGSLDWVFTCTVHVYVRVMGETEGPSICFLFKGVRAAPYGVSPTKKKLFMFICGPIGRN